MTEVKKTNARYRNDAEAMDRLRDRTDELELIISSLTIFALLSMPGWIFSWFAGIYTHLSTNMVIAGSVGTTLLAGVCYCLAICFIVHLMTRAYWVGLIGLRAAFPDGINWDKTLGLGPMSRTHYRETLPNLDTVIEKTDRLASSLFAVISMLTLSVLWFGVILVGTLVASGTIGVRFGATNSAMGVGSLVLVIIFVGVPILVYLLDAQLASRFPRLCDNSIYAGLVRFLRGIAGLAYPQRLVLPVQLTLQSNTRPFVVFAVITFSIIAIVIIGSTRSQAWRTFTVSNEFVYMDTALVQQGFRSTYYEDMASPMDRLRAWPRIDSLNQSGSFTRLFLPYQPLRDNLLLDQWCNSEDEATDPVVCLRKLWAVSIDGTPVPMTNFDPAERADIGMRGLIGLVPLEGLKPGMHKIEVVWNPEAGDDTAPIDDRYTEASATYVIPIAFAPQYELSLDK